MLTFQFGPWWSEGGRSLRSPTQQSADRQAAIAAGHLY